MQTSKPDSFRGDIEGLRGVAILLVLLYHFDIGGLTAGFIGVDVFFVISGFLMTQILIGSKFEWTRTGLSNFYLKRFLRIAPVYYLLLIGMLGVYLIAPWSMMLNKAVSAFTFSSVFAYNIIAPSNTGYFGIEATTNPFLHLWSLGVEVQFYLIWPIVLFFIRNKAGKFQLFTIGTIGLVSFMVAQILVIKDPEVAYFAVFTRLWQFMAGASVAVLIREKTKINLPLATRTVAFLSAAVIVSLSALLSSNGWPGPLAIVPTACAALIIYCGGFSSLSSFVLTNAPIRYIGKVSYSLYLVHWPLVVLGHRYITEFDENASMRLAGIVLSIVLASLLYVVIEVPFRKTRLQDIGRTTVIGGSVLLVAIFCIGVRSDNALRWVMQERLVSYFSDQERYASFEDDYCKDASKDGGSRCILGDIAAKPSYVVWGDSHARHLAFGLQDSLKGTKESAILLTYGGCPPLTNATPQKNDKATRKCLGLNNAAMEYLDTDESPETLILAARWYNYTPEYTYLVSLQQNEADKREPLAVSQALEDTLSTLQGLNKKIVIVNQAFEAPKRFAACNIAFMHEDADTHSACTVKDEEQFDRQNALNKDIAAVAAKFPNTRVVDLGDVFCRDNSCSFGSLDALDFQDGDHLSVQGSRKAVEHIFIGM